MRPTRPRDAIEHRGHRRILSSTRQLILVTSPTVDPPGYLATLRAYERPDPRAAWRPISGAWPAETGSGHLTTRREAGDHATPIGVFTIASTLYGSKPNPGGLHYPYHRLTCGDWWNEDPFTPRYNHLVHAPCHTTPPFASWSEPLWTETLAYPYLAVIQFNTHPTIAGPNAPGAGIFLHNWMNGPTEGCVALPERRLLALLRWLKPDARPVIEISVALKPIRPHAERLGTVQPSGGTRDQRPGGRIATPVSTTALKPSRS